MEFISKYKELILSVKPATFESKGNRIEFHNGRFQTTDRKVIDFLRKHERYGTWFQQVVEQGEGDKSKEA